ncbi:redoxin [Tenacibaculum sp. Bg11-29]|uniref:TlpA family protein disulfide reductase n=1 Tax=Tenacibaculum sp. Bg11-29 TaxID=2058306 RepID=UPI000C32383A|nr:redoxin family protein [Tenacibaculum sp. Bg11-29]PKH49171.1 redoxin [Tenacibaculum sp. Bg11-29]
MRKNLVLVIATYLLFSCSVYNPVEFSSKALEDTFISMNNEEVKFKDILIKNKGKKIVIDIWASWCKDCLKGLPKIKKLQETNLEIVYLYLSLDRGVGPWKEGVSRLGIKGQHYYIKTGWEGDFCKFLGLSWIPRYLVVDEEGKIIIFNETKITDNLITEILKK